MRSRKCFGILLTLAWMTGPAVALEAPPGWQKRSQEGYTVFTPANLGNRYFSVLLSEPLPLEGKSLESWGESISDALTANFGAPSVRGSPESSARLWTVTHRINAQGKQLAVVYHVFAVAQDRARFTVMAGEPDLLVQHLETGSQLIAAAIAEGGSASPASTTTDLPSRPLGNGITSSQSSSGELLPFQANAIETILNHSKTSYGVWGLEVTDTSHALLNDGRLYSNGKMAGRWRKVGNGYQFDDGAGWKPLEGEPVKVVSDKDLIGFFNADRAASFGDTSVVTRNRIRLHADGRYEISGYRTGQSSLGNGMDDATVTAGGGASSISSGGAGIRSNTWGGEKNEQGQYRLLGRYVIELRRNDGQTRQRLIYYTDDAGQWLNLDETSYKRQ